METGKPSGTASMGSRSLAEWLMVMIRLVAVLAMIAAVVRKE